MLETTPFTLEVRVLVVEEKERELVVVEVRPEMEVVARIPFTVEERTPPK
ncbi:hypothetical protein SDC9_184960 [bioreactor metagenome]|uniref:Uncharacterized protein n=1 Tax=bioreactor metagenome TaxID=1076179 RepID=A0A645HGC7_9ZZZZ